MRAIWSGAVAFGLIYIPVRLYKASEPKRIGFKLLRQGDLCPIRYSRVCEDTGEEVPYSNIVRGYEYAKGKYVVVNDEDFKRANVRKTQTIEVIQFTEPSAVNPKFLQTPYYLEPDDGAQKGYALLREALQRSKKIGIGRFVLRSREHLAVLQADQEVILLNSMRFAGEIRDPDDLSLPSEEDLENLTEQELNMAVNLINEMSEPWRPERFHDTYTEDLMRIIEEKVEGKEWEPIQEETIPTEVTDLFARLSESLQMAQAKSGRK